MLAVNMVFLVLALICFLLAAFGVQFQKVQPGWLGLFFFALIGLLK